MKTEDFKTWLVLKGYRESTVKSHLQNLGYFHRWLQEAGMPGIENLVYKNLLGYVQWEQGRGLDVATINLRLGTVRRYFGYLKASEGISGNPACGLRIKGKVKTVTEQPLSVAELEGLYTGYKALKKESLHQSRTDLAHERNVVVVGLLVWQGLHTGELQRLELSYVNLDEGTITIPSTARSNARSLRLQTPQILTLHRYLNGTREQLKPKGEELFPGNLRNTVDLLVQELKGINGKVRNAAHIRASVILGWLRQHAKRQVQYMCGHRHIDSTERYEVQEMESLKEGIKKHHPFG